MSTRRRQRRARSRGGLSETQRWALVYGDSVGMPAREDYPFASEEQARACWRKHRAELMAESFPGHAPDALWTYEPKSFVSVEAIRALRLDRRALHHGANEFADTAAIHRRAGRLQLAEEFDQRADRVRKVLDEGETNNA